MKLIWVKRSLSLLPLLYASATALAATPTPAQLLAVRPAHADVAIDTPSPASYGRLSVAPFRSGRMSGWLLRDAHGNLLRFFLDTNGDKLIDQWRFYRAGREVYRDIDTNGNGRADQHRWFNEGGTRWAVDINEDGIIDGYRVISLEEVLTQLARALGRQEFRLVKPLLATPADLAGRAAPNELNESLRQATIANFTKLTAQLRKLGNHIEVERLDLAQPATLPGPAVDGSMDLTVYRDLMIVLHGSGDTMEVMTIPWLVRIGAAWKLASLPQPAADPSAAQTAGRPQQQQPDGDRLQKLIERLQGLDSQLAAAGSPATQARLHLERARLLQQIARAATGEQAELWWRQAIDGALLAVEGNVPGASELLTEIERELKTTANKRELLSYLRYHRLSSEYSRRFQQRNADFLSVQKQYLRDLEAFVQSAEGTTAAAEALLQLGIGYELIGEIDKARAAYDRIRVGYASSDYVRKARGALRRLELEGKPFQWEWLGLSRFQSYALRGKHVLVYFWATWCEPCKEELKEVAQLQRRFGSSKLAVVTVLLDKDVAAARTFLQSIGGGSWMMIEGKQGMDSEPAVQLGVFSLPTALLVGPDGKVLSRNVHADQIRTTLERVSARR